MRQLDEMLSSEAVTLVRVLEQIRREGPISQIEIGQRLGLGRAAINIHVKKLQAQQIIIPVGSNDDQAMGRPRVLLDLNREGKAVLGISLDAPRLSGAIMDFSNRIIHEQTINVGDVSDFASLEVYVLQLVKNLSLKADQAGMDLYSACFAVPGVLEPGTGRVVNYVNMPAANGLDVKELINRLLGIPAYVVPLGAALYWGGLEANQNEQSIFHVIWDMGVGMMFGRGYEIGLKRYTKYDVMSVTGGLRDIGHATLHPNGKLCSCGRRGCLEAYLGGMAITHKWNERHQRTALSFNQLIALAEKGEPRAIEMFSRNAKRLGQKLGWMFTVHQPLYIKLSGQIPDAVKQVRSAFWEGVQSHIGENNTTKFDYVGDAHSLGLVGSCRLALHVRFNKPLLEIVSDDNAYEMSHVCLSMG